MIVAPATTGYVSAIAGSILSTTYSVAVADVTGDGLPDLISPNYDSNNVSVIARNADDDGWEPSTIAGSTGPSPVSVAVGDVTGDGHPDIVIANLDGLANQVVSLIARNGAGTGWEPSTTVPTAGRGPGMVVVADVTGDGRLDLITANLTTNNVAVTARNSTGMGWEASTIAGTTGSNPRSVAVADVTGDGRPDLVTANRGADNVSVIERNAAGTGWQPSAIAGTTGAYPQSVAVADVTGDGRPDLAISNGNSDNVSVIARKSDGSGWEPPSIAGTTGALPYSVAAADVTGDGRPDLITATSTATTCR